MYPITAPYVVPTCLGYLACWCAGYLASSAYQSVWLKRASFKQLHRANERAQRRSFISWLLICAVETSLLATIAVGLVAAASTSENHWTSTEPYIACNCALLLFFGSAILPDPDKGIQQTATNAHTWLLSAVFEIVFAVLLIFDFQRSVEFGPLVAGLTVLSICRALLLVTVCVVYSAPLACGDDPVVLEEEEALNGHATESYGTTKSKQIPPPQVTDAQSTGWLDYVSGFYRLFPYVWPTGSLGLQIRVSICFLLLIGQRVVNLLVPFLLGSIVASLGYGHIPLPQIFLYVAARGLQGQLGVLASIRALLWIPIGQATYRRLTKAAFDHVLSLSLEFHLGKRLGEVMSALTKGGTLNTFLDSLVFQLFPMVADLGIAAVYLLVSFDPFYSLAIIAMGATYLYATIYMAKYRARARREMISRDRESDAVKSDAIMSYEVVHYNGGSVAESNRLSDRIAAYQKAEYSVLFSLNLLNGMQNAIFTLGVLCVALISAWNVSIGIEQVATFVALLAYLTQLQAPLSFFGSFYTQIQNSLIDAERMLALFLEEPTVVDDPDAEEVLECSGHVRFENVSFSYRPGYDTLKDINLDIKPGKSIAIVGESGSGKSTLLRLLFRFYDVSSGSIKVDGRDIRKVKIRSLRDQFGVVPQETMLFNDTLMYNLLYAKPQATEEEVYAACKVATVYDQIMRFPDQFETMVGERGLRLSGGEKQRIAIARAALKSPKIVLLDEATASLDTATEAQIQKSLSRISEGRTTITIAHRLSTVVHSDEIIVLQKGRIVEKGSHFQLLLLNGQYAQMWQKQTENAKTNT